jgi:MtfA peptidase
MFAFLRRRRREKLRRQPLPAHWHEVLTREMRLYPLLPDALQQQLLRITQILLAEKSFEGCGGFELTEAVRLTVAAHASLLLLNREINYYPLLHAILLYPDAFVARHVEEDEEGLVWEMEEEQEGESWSTGTVILSWRDVERDKRVLNGRNVLIHEFAHQLYDAGEFFLDDAGARDAWVRVFEQHFHKHVDAVERGRRTFLDEYGAEDEAEFFSVVSEAFFEQPRKLAERHPQLYDTLCACYAQDPRTYSREPGEQ